MDGNFRPSQMIDTENKVEQETPKKGIDFAFEQNPKLASVGTKEQYSGYLNTIFTETEFKDIAYHATKAKEVFSEFKRAKIKPLVINSNQGFYFSDSIEHAKSILKLRDGSLVICALVNIKNPLSRDVRNKIFFKRDDAVLKDKKHDSIMQKTNDNGVDNITELVLFEPNQIHILGSKADIEGFKEFVEKQNTIPDSGASTENQEIS